METVVVGETLRFHGPDTCFEPVDVRRRSSVAELVQRHQLFRRRNSGILTDDHFLDLGGSVALLSKRAHAHLSVFHGLRRDASGILVVLVGDGRQNAGEVRGARKRRSFRNAS